MSHNDRIQLTHYHDVREANDACDHNWFVNHPFAISAFSIDVNRCFGDWDETIAIGVDHLIKVVESLEDFKMHPFVLSHWRRMGFIGSGRIARYKQYWNSPTGLANPSQLHRGAEVEIDSSPSHVSFATAALVNRDILLDTTLWLRRQLNAHLFIYPKLPKLNEKTVREFVAQDTEGMHAMRPAKFVPFAKHVADNSGIYLRLWGGFDDPEFCIQLYYRPDLIELSLR